MFEEDSSERIAQHLRFFFAMEVLELALGENNVARFNILACLFALLGEHASSDDLFSQIELILNALDRHTLLGSGAQFFFVLDVFIHEHVSH